MYNLHVLFIYVFLRNFKFRWFSARSECLVTLVSKYFTPDPIIRFRTNDMAMRRGMEIVVPVWAGKALNSWWDAEETAEQRQAGSQRMTRFSFFVLVPLFWYSWLPSCATLCVQQGDLCYTYTFIIPFKFFPFRLLENTLTKFQQYSRSPLSSHS